MTPITRLVLREGGPPVQLRLRLAAANALIDARVIDIRHTKRNEIYEVSAGTQIGVVNIDGMQLVIQPKIDINRLVFLMSYARKPSFWRDDRVKLAAADSVPAALASAFLRYTHRALDQGLLKGYRTVEETLPVLRGRVREADQLRHHFGRGIPLEVRYDEYTVDVAENQLLLAAAETLLRTPGLGAVHRGGLQRIRMQLADVTAPTRGGIRPTWTASRLNVRYQPALELAELILDGRSFEQGEGPLAVTGYLFNMATVFEDFVTVALREELSGRGGTSTLQYRAHLDEAETVSILPDFVWSEQGTPRVVADAKYKAEKPSGFPNADLYQMLAYCTVLRLDEGHLVYAKGEETAKVHSVRGSDVRIIAHTLDLNEEPASILAAVKLLADEMAGPETATRGLADG